MTSSAAHGQSPVVHRQSLVVVYTVTGSGVYGQSLVVVYMGSQFCAFNMLTHRENVAF